MKKIKLFVIILLSAIFVLSVNSSFALENPNATFNLSNIFKQENVTWNSKDVTVLNISPLAILVIKPGTFKEDVTALVYEGNFDNIRNKIPVGQSSISSYYLTFRASKGYPVTPLIPINVQAVNNYAYTDTFFYPMLSATEIDKPNEKFYKGNVRINENLPVNDPGFIVAVNKLIAKDDAALQRPTTAPTATSIQNQPTTASKNGLSSLFPVIAALLVVMTALSFVFYLMYKKAK